MSKVRRVNEVSVPPKLFKGDLVSDLKGHDTVYLVVGTSELNVDLVHLETGIVYRSTSKKLYSKFLKGEQVLMVQE